MKITDAMPTGTGSITQGCTIDIGIEHDGFKPPWNVDIGTGTVSALGAYDFAVSGPYAFDTLGFSGSGTFKLSVSSNDGGATWSASAEATGTWSFNTSSIAVEAVESGSGENTTITYTAEGVSVVQTFQNDSAFQKAKVFLAFELSGTPIMIYMYNLTTYGDLRDVRKPALAA